MTPVLELSGVVKQYGGLRPLRIAQLAVAAGDVVVLRGIDLPGAEVFVNLATGVTLPDSGTVHVFGRSTAAITDSSDWLATADRFGIVSERAVLLDGLTVVQNLAMPFTLEIEPPPEDVRDKAMRLADDVGLSAGLVDVPVADLGPADRVRVRLGRALALDPAVLLLEHPTAALPQPDVAPVARDMARVARARQLAVVAISADEGFAGALGGRALLVDPASGRLESGGRGGWFTRRRQ